MTGEREHGNFAADDQPTLITAGARGRVKSVGERFGQPPTFSDVVLPLPLQVLQAPGSVATTNGRKITLTDNQEVFMLNRLYYS